jgi:hypothetical protein
VPTHSDPADLALHALGEDVGPDVDAHLASCAECRDEVERLRSVVAVARTTGPDDAPQPPPASVWDGIVAELGLGGAASGDTDEAGTDDPSGAVDELSARRAGSRMRTALVAAAAAVVGIALGVGGSALLGDDDSGGQGAVVASAELAALPDRQGTGAATVRGSGSQRVLVLDVSDLTTGAGVYEVWLLDADAQRLVSLGLLEGTSGRFALPPSLDVADFPVVDVSIEPLDGDPAHSGDSVVRGTLTS